MKFRKILNCNKYNYLKKIYKNFRMEELQDQYI